MMQSISLRRRFQRLESARFLPGELELRQQLAHQIDKESRLKRLGMNLGIDDPELLERLSDSGLTGENALAFVRLPLAAVAWGSGNVTHAEFREAIDAAITSTDSPDALRKFRSWLDHPPTTSLWSLWERVTTERIRFHTEAEFRLEGQRLLEQAQRIALASGGVWGVGKICAGEQRILDRISEVYGI